MYNTNIFHSQCKYVRFGEVNDTSYSEWVNKQAIFNILISQLLTQVIYCHHGFLSISKGCWFSSILLSK